MRASTGFDEMVSKRFTMPRGCQTIFPNWSKKLEFMRRALLLSQHASGKRIGVSAMAVSRWERGTTEPSGNAYLKLGNIAGDPLCWYFWRRAGLTPADVMRVLPHANRRLKRMRTGLLAFILKIVPLARNLDAYCGPRMAFVNAEDSLVEIIVLFEDRWASFAILSRLLSVIARYSSSCRSEISNNALTHFWI
jgi:DNA-binding transcriptional regulator YiaG